MLQDTKCQICGAMCSKLNGSSKVFYWQLQHMQSQHPIQLAKLKRVLQDLKLHVKLIKSKVDYFTNNELLNRMYY